MIRIIKGTYGLKVNGVVEAMTAGSAPFSLSEAREAELVASGVAEKVEGAEPHKETETKAKGKRKASTAPETAVKADETGGTE